MVSWSEARAVTKLTGVFVHENQEMLGLGKKGGRLGIFSGKRMRIT